jgi:hypothetical protein
MTEAEWLNGVDAPEMLRFAVAWASERQLRLFACACCRQIWHSLSDERSRHAIVTSELYADRRVTKKELRQAQRQAWAAFSAMCGNNRASEAARAAAWSAAWKYRQAAANTWDAAANAVEQWIQERDRQCHALRDIFGNPFRRSLSVTSAVLAWNDGTVRRIAQGIYEERAFDLLPILADALLDAGCDNEDIFAHCRSAGPHVRGCWVLDLLLGKV